MCCPQLGSIAVTGEVSEFAVPVTAAAGAVAYGYPALFQVDDSWLLVTESDISGNYGASRLTLDPATRRFRLTLPDAQENSTGPLRTPWRTMVIGDLATVTESDLVTDLAAPSTVDDMSWIRPGRSAWSWWSDGPSSRDPVAQRRYVDYDVEAAKRYLPDAQYRQLKAYFERTLLTVRLHRSVSRAYFGYRIWVRDPSYQTPALQRTIWDGLTEARQVAELVRTYPQPAATGEWNWVIDAAQADLYYNRIANGWDRYGNISVPPPAG
jgi:hypothetical protein